MRELVYKATMEKVRIGDKITLPNKRVGIIRDIKAPSLQCPRGTVDIELDNQISKEYLPTIIGATWI